MKNHDGQYQLYDSTPQGKDESNIAFDWEK